jgi:hypothetical protein
MGAAGTAAAAASSNGAEDRTTSFHLNAGNAPATSSVISRPRNEAARGKARPMRVAGAGPASRET